MNLELAALCDAATEQAGKLNILGAFDCVFSQSFPFVHPQCAFALRLRFNRVEQGQHTVRVEFVDADGKAVIPPLEANIQLSIPEGNDSQVSNLILNMFHLKIEKPGRYTIDVAINNRHETSLPLKIVDVTPKEPNPLKREG